MCPDSVWRLQCLLKAAFKLVSLTPNHVYTLDSPCRTHPTSEQFYAGRLRRMRRRLVWISDSMSSNKPSGCLLHSRCIKYKSTADRVSRVSRRSEGSKYRATVFEPQIIQAHLQSCLDILWLMEIIWTIHVCKSQQVLEVSMRMGMEDEDALMAPTAGSLHLCHNE